MVLVGSNPARRKAVNERLLKATLSPLRTINSIGNRSGDISPERSSLATDAIDCPLNGPYAKVGLTLAWPNFILLATFPSLIAPLPPARPNFVFQISLNFL